MNNKNKFEFGRYLIPIFIITLVYLSGCMEAIRPDQTTALQSNTKYNFILPVDVTTTHLRDPFIKTGIDALIQNDYEVASSAFNHALKFEPQNAYLHFLNAFTYHLMAYQGDYSKTELAEVGYQLARQFNNTAWWVEYFNGLLAFETKHYDLAQAFFARTLVLDPDNLEAMKGLAITSYYLGDIEIAYQAVNNAISTHHNDPELIRSAALVFAAAGKQGEARQYLDSYKDKNLPDYKLNHVAERINDWARAYEQQKNNVVVAENNSMPIDTDAQEQNNKISVQTATSSTRQLIVDVIIIRSEERITNRRGINLLDGLNITFGATDVNTITQFDSSYRELIDTAGNLTRLNLFTFPSIFTRTLSIPTVTYSLNIFNTLEDRHEIIARPSLMALDGTQSTFFSGAELSVGFAGTLQGGNLDKKEVGVSLNVSPTFLEDDRVLLTVTAKRDFFEEEQFGSFEQAVQTSKNQVSASAVVGFDQTLVLSGLSEKETENIQDKVPVLGDIPLLKTFFNEETDLEFNKSVMFMLTPRRVVYVNDEAMGQSESSAMSSERIKALLKQWRDYGVTEPNIIHIMHNESDWIKKHVRAGDLSYKGWEQKENIELAVNTTLERLYD